MEILNWQKNLIESREQLNKNNLEKEKKTLREQWTQEVFEETERKKLEKINNLKMFQEIEEFNKTEYEKKFNLLKEEKLKDKNLINDIVEKEKALDEIDKKEKVIILNSKI